MDPDKIANLFAHALQPDQISCSSTTLRQAEIATFPTDGTYIARLMPKTTDHVREIVRIANDHGLQLYPISGGKNWGYGSRTPLAQNAIMVDLGAMDRIHNHDEYLGTVVVEPGVTFAALQDYLIAQKSRLFLNPPSSSMYASVLANALSNGLVRGITGNRAETLANLTVVLASAQVINTGFAGEAAHQSARSHKASSGPSFTELFHQSDLGIVTQATIHLDRFPPFWQHFELPLQYEVDLPAAIDVLRTLYQSNTICAVTSVYDRQKIVNIGHENIAIPASWSMIGSVLAGSVQALVAFRDIVLEQFAQAQFAPINEAGATFGRTLDSRSQLSEAYAGKTNKPSVMDDPDRDGCGLIWVSPACPMIGNSVNKCVQIIKETSARHGMKASVSIQCIDARAAYLIGALTYDREDENAEKVAMNCHDELLNVLAENGFGLYRHSHRSKSKYSENPNDAPSMLRLLQPIFDPNHVLTHQTNPS
jgi:4-cresol dehydrogenase (hydroxylating)